MVNAEFSRIYRFVKLLVNEDFLAVDVVGSPGITPQSGDSEGDRPSGGIQALC